MVMILDEEGTPLSYCLDLLSSRYTYSVFVCIHEDGLGNLSVELNRMNFKFKVCLAIVSSYST